MIKGAVELITGVPGRFIDPFHLASSQVDSFLGYVLVAYSTQERVWDLLFLQGRTVSEGARITEHAPPADRQGDGLLERRQVEPSDIESRFATSALRERSRLYLFEATALQVDPFIKTLRSVPALKVQVDPLSREQLVRLVRNLNAPRLIAERALLHGALPCFEFLEIKSPQQPVEFQMRFRKGMLLLYTPDEGRGVGAQLALGLEPESAQSGELPPILQSFLRQFNEATTGILSRKEFLPRERERDLFLWIPQMVKSASAFRRGRLRRKVLGVLNEFYSDRYEELKEAKLLPQIEICYRELKR
jgi:hypothetical protein